MNRLLYILLFLFFINSTAISQISWVGNYSINKHFFTENSDSLLISIDLFKDGITDKDNADSTIICRLNLESSKYIQEGEIIQNTSTLIFKFNKKTFDNKHRYVLHIPTNIFNRGRYSINILITDNNWTDSYSYNEEIKQLEPITIGNFGFVEGMSKLEIDDDKIKFAFLDFKNHLDISSNKLEGIYTEGFCSDELVTFSDFNFHIWAIKTYENISLTTYYSIDDGEDIKLINYDFIDESSDGLFSFNEKKYEYNFYKNENLVDFSINILDKINDLINLIELDESINHQIKFKFSLEVDGEIENFPENGKLEYTIKIINSPKGAKCQAALLPIDLLKWGTRKKDKTVTFEWKTASELNNAYFELQKSEDSENWINITKIKGNGTTNQPVTYNFIDYFPYPGQNFYRLRQTDFDGNFKYSKVKSIFIFDNKLKLYPNPTTDFIYYSIADYTKEFKVEIYDESGRLVKSLILPLKNSNADRIDVRYLKRGSYFIKYINLQNFQVKINTLIKL